MVITTAAVAVVMAEVVVVAVAMAEEGVMVVMAEGVMVHVVDVEDPITAAVQTPVNFPVLALHQRAPLLSVVIQTVVSFLHLKSLSSH